MKLRALNQNTQSSCVYTLLIALFVSAECLSSFSDRKEEITTRHGAPVEVIAISLRLLLLN